MEFGIFLNGYIPGPGAHDSEWEHRDEVLELLELFGDKVIPEHDPDRVHSTDPYRATAMGER